MHRVSRARQKQFSLAHFVCASVIFLLFDCRLSTAEAPPKIPDEVFEKFAAAARLPEDHPAIREFRTAVLDKMARSAKLARAGNFSPEAIKNIKAPEPPQLALTPPTSLAQELLNIKIIKHLKAPHGIPFPPVEIPTLSSEGRERTRRALKNFQASMLADAQALAEMPPLPNCLRDEAELLPPEEEAPQRWAAGDKDVLFLRGDVPKEHEEMFGPLVLIIPCPDIPGNACTVMREQLGIDCLPSRLRTRGDKTSRHTGKSALLNFERDKHGVLAERTKQKLYELLGVKK